MNFAVLLADADPNGGDFFSFWKKPGSTAGEIGLVLGAVVIVGLIIFIWAAVIRTPRHRKHTYNHLYESEGGGLPQRRKRRSGLARLLNRKRHKRHRQRERPTNPTLAEIGGLPPQREDPPS
jgi:hypothetical protein